MKAVVIGAGLGGLAAALRLQGAGAEVTVVEQRSAPGGRAGRIRDRGFTWDTGPSLLTMPWVLGETFAAAGMDLDAELTLHRLEPLYRIRWAGESEHLDFFSDPLRLREEVAKFSAADAAALERLIAALEPIYRDGVLGAGRRPFGSWREFAPVVPGLLRRGAMLPLHAFVSRFLSHPRVREAFTFHSLFIGGDPYRVPAIYGALIYLQLLDGGWYTEGGIHAVVEAMARPLDVRCGEPVERIEHAGGHVTGVRLAGGERLAADVVISNADVLRTAELVGRAPPRRRMRETMSCLLLYLGTRRRFDSLLHHTLLVGEGYREFIRAVTRDRVLPRSFSTYVHAPARTEAAMAAPGGDSLAVLLPVPNLRAGIDWSREADRLRAAVVADLELRFGLDGLDDAVVVEHRMTPLDFLHEYGAVWGNAFALEPTLQQSAYFRHPNRDRRLGGLYFVGGGTHPGAGIPGVLLGAAVTVGLVARDHELARPRVPAG
jgi:phytoene desaturase